MVSSILLLVKEFKIYVHKSTQNSIFSLICLNVSSSFNIKDRLLKFSVLVLDMIMEGTVSQIFLLGPSSCFMKCRKLCLQIY